MVMLGDSVSGQKDLFRTARGVWRESEGRNKPKRKLFRSGRYCPECGGVLSSVLVEGVFPIAGESSDRSCHVYRLYSCNCGYRWAEELWGMSTWTFREDRLRTISSAEQEMFDSLPDTIEYFRFRKDL